MSTVSVPQRPLSKIFHAVTHVWGREYLDVFLNVCIPNQLAPGNIPALPQGSRYRILTGSEHVTELQGHPMVRALRGVIPVDIIVIEEIDRRRHTAVGHELMIACHRRATADILDADAAIIMLSADFVLSENALAAVVQRHREGYRAIVNTGLRLAKDEFIQHLRESRAPLSSLSPRALVKAALPFLHPHTQSMFTDAERFSESPVAVYWRVGGEGLLGRCMHLHPLMVDPMIRLPLRVGTNDGPYVAQSCPDFSRVHVVTDSDELQMFELTRADREVVPTRVARVSALPAVIMAAKCDALQLRSWQQHPVFIHTADLGPAWNSAEAASERFVRRVMRGRPHAKHVRRWLRFVRDVDKRRARFSKTWHRQQRRFRLERVRKWSDRQVRAWDRRRPRITSKQFQRPIKLLTHRVAKMAGGRLKRIRRRLRLA